jgi:hypothetical protein
MINVLLGNNLLGERRHAIKPAMARDLKNMLAGKERGFQHLKGVDKGAVQQH